MPYLQQTENAENRGTDDSCANDVCFILTLTYFKTKQRQTLPMLVGELSSDFRYPRAVVCWSI